MFYQTNRNDYEISRRRQQDILRAAEQRHLGESLSNQSQTQRIGSISALLSMAAAWVALLR